MLEIDYNENLLCVNGTIPGKIGNFLTIFKR
jgi:ribosomal protein L3